MTGLFDRVLCGVDGSVPGLIAARQAARLTAPEGELTLVAVEEPSLAAEPGRHRSSVLSELAAEASAALARGRVAVEGIHEAGGELAEGHPADALLAKARERNATLLAVGSHGHSRVAGIAFGSVATLTLHEAPCAVLVARGREDDAGWPRTIVVGLDGSPESVAALHAARELAGRLGATVQPVAGAGDRRLDVGAVRALAEDVQLDEAGAVDALAIASEDADLVVVGSRGLHGIRALGSVSERIGHEARCSVLVVRGGR